MIQSLYSSVMEHLIEISIFLKPDKNSDEKFLLELDDDMSFKVDLPALRIHKNDYLVALDDRVWINIE